ncbi:SDR family NAD(P)-dependent oxidoreductase [Clostridium cylindrosporum]|uniref:3-oxoacyl-[acyl-carrier-protein] reductase FabG n=1 Tax=Clostridium cylindrosporum DSM 605 TaxID=1121307 RepID=A0A0J8D9W9_CLOCY|nr:SDR family oxidoreductase [Clostridium cylindrosporum]KMT22850.1 3-oxoacyl-[acyl-carrier-protein] reductase FabG [Clostridium cylindrosporum DSM 605]
MSLKDKVVIITGGTSGIGRVSAERFLKEGTKVMIAGTGEEKSRAVAEELGTINENVSYVKVDVSNYKSVENMIEKTLEAFGTIDILFNNAGITINKPFLEQTEEDYLKVIGVNQHGVFNGIHIFGKKLIELNKKGTIINTASIAARITGPTMMGYATSKAAVEMLTKSAAMDLAPYGIRVVGVGPGVINTPMISELKAQALDYLKNMHARKEILEPEQIADVVVFLAKEEASGINGQVVFVDDGYINFK